MNPQTAEELIAINRRFYAARAAEFAETRRRIQPGVARVLADLPDEAGTVWLDLGCGSGWLALEWLRAGRRSGYRGLDFSAALLAEARAQAARAFPEASQVDFSPADFSRTDWDAGWAAGSVAGGMCFAVLHHLPGCERRLDFLRRAARLLRPNGQLWLSVWQFQNSPKLLARQLPWSAAGIAEEQLEEGDALLDWRHPRGGAPALRYVHRFTAEELAGLAAEAGLRVSESFESDGQGGRLGLYLGCVKATI